LRIALRKIEPSGKFYAVVHRKSDFAPGGHRELLITQSTFGPTVIESDSDSRAEEDAAERRVEPARDDAHLLVLASPSQRMNLPTCCAHSSGCAMVRWPNEVSEPG
jgi:hypothetical protein